MVWYTSIIDKHDFEWETVNSFHLVKYYKRLLVEVMSDKNCIKRSESDVNSTETVFTILFIDFIYSVHTF